MRINKLLVHKLVLVSYLAVLVNGEDQNPCILESIRVFPIQESKILGVTFMTEGDVLFNVGGRNHYS